MELGLQRLGHQEPPWSQAEAQSVLSGPGTQWVPNMLFRGLRVLWPCTVWAFQNQRTHPHAAFVQCREGCVFLQTMLLWHLPPTPTAQRPWVDRIVSLMEGSPGRMGKAGKAGPGLVACPRHQTLSPGEALLPCESQIHTCELTSRLKCRSKSGGARLGCHCFLSRSLLPLCPSPPATPALWVLDCPSCSLWSRGT